MSFTNGGLDSSKRTNYVVGMVLGVDDFEQEHAYLAARAASLARALVGGGGISSGLKLSVDETTVSVSPGSAIDASGQLVTVPNEQCADLGDWVAANQDQLPETPCEAMFYVVLSYGESLTDPVAIPPGISTSAESLTAPSRVQDTFQLELTTQAPDETQQEADQAFAVWMSQLTYVDEGASTIEDMLTALAEAVAEEASAPVTLPPPLSTLQIPTGEAAVFFRAALQAWVTELSPRAQAAAEGNGAGTSASGAIAIGTLTAELATSDEGQTTIVPGSASVSSEGVPVVLSSQLLQQLIVPAPTRTPTRPAGVVWPVAAGRFEIRREYADSTPELEVVFADNLKAHLVPRPGTSGEEAEYEEARAHELYIRLRLHHGYHARHRYILSALPLVEAHGARYAIEQVYDLPHGRGGSHEGPFMLRLAPVEGAGRSLRVGFSVQITRLGHESREQAQ